MSDQPPYSPGSYPPPGGSPGYPPSYGAPPPRKSSMVSQVPLVATFLIVQGSLEALLGILLFFMGPAIMFMGRGDLARSRDDTAGLYVISGVYIVIGVALVIVAAIKISGGIRNLKYRGRVHGIVALASAGLSMLTCYCALTGIPLLIYGLIVYLNEDSRRAFEMGEQGASPSQIKQSF